jgi:hypothetical protein
LKKLRVSFLASRRLDRKATLPVRPPQTGHHTYARARLSPPAMHQPYGKSHPTSLPVSASLHLRLSSTAKLTTLIAPWPSKPLFPVSAPTRQVDRVGMQAVGPSKAAQGCKDATGGSHSLSALTGNLQQVYATSDRFVHLHMLDEGLHAARAVLVGRSQCTLGESVRMFVSELRHMVYTDTR